MGPSESGLAPDSASNIPEPGYALYVSSEIIGHADVEHPSPQSAEAAAQYDALAYAQQPTPQYDQPASGTMSRPRSSTTILGLMTRE